jgi:YVTN family beta-propeller protein
LVTLARRAGALTVISVCLALGLGGLRMARDAGHTAPVLTGAEAARAGAPVTGATANVPVAAPSPSPSPPAPFNVYAETISGRINSAAAEFPFRVYVPDNNSHTVFIIDPTTYKVVDQYKVGTIPYHVAPAWDLTKLYSDDEGSSFLTVISPKTGRPEGTIPVPNPYNLYFTPDGTKAVVVVERLRRLDFRDPHNWQLIKSVAIPWPGVDHLDFSADGSYLLASTEFSGEIVKVDTNTMEITGMVSLGGLPIDVRLAPDGTVFYIANQKRNGVSIIEPVAMKEVGFIPTGKGAHGLQVSRDTRFLYVSNRLEGTISVIDFATRQVTGSWRTGGSPDMLQISPNGRELWASGRFEGAVYVVDTTTGQLMHNIKVGIQPHGLTYFPNAGRYSLGHNGVYR